MVEVPVDGPLLPVPVDGLYRAVVVVEMMTYNLIEPEGVASLLKVNAHRHGNGSVKCTFTHQSIDQSVIGLSGAITAKITSWMMSVGDVRI